MIELLFSIVGFCTIGSIRISHCYHKMGKINVRKAIATFELDKHVELPTVQRFDESSSSYL